MSSVTGDVARLPRLVLPIEAGLRRPLVVRHERIRQTPDACRLLYISDVHLRAGRSEMLSEQVLDVVLWRAVFAPSVPLHR